MTEQTKITVKVVTPQLFLLGQLIDAAHMKRDAFLNTVIRHELSYLRDEMKGKRLSAKARRYVAQQLEARDTTTINIKIDREVADDLNSIVEASNMVRDAFLNRLILFLRAKESLLDWLEVPKRLDDKRFQEYEGLPTAPMQAIHKLVANPLFYIRGALTDLAAEKEIPEEHSKLYLLPLPEPFVGLSCYLDDTPVPGTKAHRASEAKEVETARLLAEWDRAEAALSNPKPEEKQ